MPRRIRCNSPKTLFALVFVSIALFALSLTVSRAIGGDYLDEIYYIKSGLEYIECALPASSNPEHPPLGKYMIGVFSFIEPRIAPALFGTITVALLTISIARLRSEPLISLLAVLALTYDVAFTKTFNYSLLDPIAIGFSSVATYPSLFHSKPIISGMFWGAALASKLPTAYPFLGIFLFKLWERRYRDALVEVLAAGLVYVSSFAGDVFCPGGGVELLLSHLIFVPTYMLSVHSLSIHKVVQGLQVALLKVGFWGTQPPATVTVVPNATTEVNLVLGGASGIEVHLYLWLSGFLLPSSIALLTYSLLRFKSLGRVARAVTVMTLFSYVNVLHGAVFWYLTLPAYYLALLAGSVLSRRTLALLAAANVASLVAVYLLGIRDTIVITLPGPG